jgi:hypothetical protein
MSLGTAFLRPKALETAPAHGPSRAFDLVTEFLESLIADPARLSATLEALTQSGGGHLQTFLVARQEKFRRAEGKVRLIFKPFSDVLAAFMAGMGAGIAETLPAALNALRGLVAMARKDSVTHMLREMIRLGQSDLDINAAAVEALFRQCIEGAVAELQRRVNAGDLSEEALKRFEWGTNLRNFEHLVLEELDWPGLDVDELVKALGALYDRKGVEAILGKIQKVLDAADSLAEPLALLLQTVMERRAPVGGSVGAAADGDAGPTDGGATTENISPISQYATWILRTEARCAVDETTTLIAPIPAVSYNCIKPLGMERLAFHSLWITDLTETILHIISIEQNDIWSNLLNTFWDTFNTINTPIDKIVVPSWLQWIFLGGNTLLGGLENVRCSGSDDVAFPFIQILGDMGETVLYRRWTWLAREFVLSTVTLANINETQFTAWKAEYDVPYQARLDEIAALRTALDGTLSDADKTAKLARLRELVDSPEMMAYRFTMRQANQNQFHGVVMGIGELGALVLPAVLSGSDRDEYGFTTGFLTAPMAGKMFGGLAVMLGFRGAALLAAAGISRKFTDDATGALYSWLLLANERMLWNPKDAESTGSDTGRGFWIAGNLIIEWIMQAIYLYLFTNGNTDGGTYAGYRGVPGKFPGYPDAATSPYKLPWKEGDLIECAQNPMGIWSHFPDSGQAHAYDYSHDAGTEVLASRGGIVTTLTQDKINNNKDDWNSIEILSLQVVAAGSAGAMPSVPAPNGITDYTDTGTTDNPRTATVIEANTLFPPYWDVYGNPWHCLPRPFPLLPSGAILPAGTALGTGIPAGSEFTFLIPEHDRGLAGTVYPAGSKFSDGVEIPAGVCFAPDAASPPEKYSPMYLAGTTFSPLRGNFTAKPFDPDPANHPGSIPGFAPAAGAKFLNNADIPAGVVLPPDAAVTQPWLPRPHQATPLYRPDTQFFLLDAGHPLPVTGTSDRFNTLQDYINPCTNYLPVGTPFPDIPTALPTDRKLKASTMPTLNYQWFAPVICVFTQYGHALSGFSSIPNFTYAPPTAAPADPKIIRDLAPGEAVAAMPGQPDGPLTDVFGTANNALIAGQLVPQGRVVMLSGDTGVSAYNHLHTHVLLDTSDNYWPFEPYETEDDGKFTGPGGMIFTAPFVYQDAVHGLDHGFREAGQSDGVPRAMTWYESKNARTGP